LRSNEVIEFCRFTQSFQLYYALGFTQLLTESQRERDHWEDQDVGGWIILGWVLERWDGVMWTGLAWLRIGTGGELL
jgi:hypothetical protein